MHLGHLHASLALACLTWPPIKPWQAGQIHRSQWLHPRSLLLAVEQLQSAQEDEVAFFFLALRFFLFTPAALLQLSLVFSLFFPLFYLCSLSFPLFPFLGSLFFSLSLSVVLLFFFLGFCYLCFSLLSPG